MLTEFINTLMAILSDVFLPNDVFRAVVAVVVALVAGMVMKEYKLGKVVNTVLAALAIFGFILAIRNFVSFFGGNVTAIGPWLDSTLNAFLNLQLGVILVYFIAFFFVVSVAYAIRKGLKS